MSVAEWIDLAKAIGPVVVILWGELRLLPFLRREVALVRALATKSGLDASAVEAQAVQDTTGELAQLVPFAEAAAKAALAAAAPKKGS